MHGVNFFKNFFLIFIFSYIAVPSVLFYNNNNNNNNRYIYGTL